MAKPMPMRDEADRAIDVAKVHSPAASWWRGDVRECDDLAPGRTFDLVDDSNPNHWEVVGQFRAVTLTAAPEGYVAVVAVQSSAVASQIPTVRTSQVIKHTMTHAPGTMGAMPVGIGLDFSAAGMLSGFRGG